MDLYHLKTFFTLAKAKSFTKAAGMLFVTQSAVSHAVKKLETSVGTPLILRKGKTIGVTEAGTVLFRSCEKIFYELERTEEELSRYTRQAKRRIRLGSTVEFGTTILIKHIRDFLETHPDIHLDFHFSHDLEPALIQDEVDLIIDCKVHTLPQVDMIHLFQEQYVTIASPRFVKEHRIRTLDDLARVNILSHDKPLDWWHNFITAIPDEKRSCLKNVVRINHVRGLINGAMTGLGVAFVPKYTVIRELAQNVLIDPFPWIRPGADHFNIFIKSEKLGFQRNQVLVDYLTRLNPSEFGVG